MPEPELVHTGEGKAAIRQRSLEEIFYGIEEAFDPEGTGYDYSSASDYGLEPDKSGHWQSRIELDEHDLAETGLPEGAGLILKGRKHPTWHLTERAEGKAGYNIIRHPNGRFYSVPVDKLGEEPGGPSLEEIFSRVPKAAVPPPEGFEFNRIPTEQDVKRRRYADTGKQIQKDLDKLFSALEARRRAPSEFNNAVLEIVRKGIEKTPDASFVTREVLQQLHRREQKAITRNQKGWWGTFLEKSWDELSETVKQVAPILPQLKHDVDMQFDSIRDATAAWAEQTVEVSARVARQVLAGLDEDRLELAIRDAKFGTLNLIKGFTDPKFMSVDAREFLAEALKDPGAGRQFLGGLMEGTGFIANMALISRFLPAGEAGKIQRTVQRGITAGAADWLRGGSPEHVAETVAFWTAMGFTGEGLLGAAKLTKAGFLKLIPEGAKEVGAQVFDKFRTLAPPQLLSALRKIGPGIREFGIERTFDVGESINDALAWATMTSKTPEEFMENAAAMFVSSVFVNMGSEMALDAILKGAELPTAMNSLMVKAAVNHWVDRNHELYDEVEREAMKAATEKLKLKKDATVKETIDEVLRMKKPRPKLLKPADKAQTEDFGLSEDQRKHIEQRVTELGSIAAVNEAFPTQDPGAKYAKQIAEGIFPAEVVAEPIEEPPVEDMETKIGRLETEIFRLAEATGQEDATLIVPALQVAASEQKLSDEEYAAKLEAGLETLRAGKKIEIPAAPAAPAPAPPKKAPEPKRPKALSPTKFKSLVIKNTDEKGNLTRGVSFFAPEIRKLSDKGLESVFNWAKQQSPMVSLHIGDAVAAEMKAREKPAPIKPTAVKKPKPPAEPAKGTQEMQTERDAIEKFTKQTVGKSFLELTPNQQTKTMNEYYDSLPGETKAKVDRGDISYKMEYSTETAKTVPSANAARLVLDKVVSASPGMVKGKVGDGAFLIVDEAENKRIKESVREQYIKREAKKIAKRENITLVEGQAKATKFYDKLIKEAQEPAAQKVINNALQQKGEEAYPQIMSIGPDVDYVLLSSGEVQIKMDAGYYNYFTKTFPGARFIIPTETTNKPIRVVKNKKLVGLVMPLLRHTGEPAVYAVGPGFKPATVEVPANKRRGSRIAGDFAPPGANNPRVPGGTSAAGNHILGLPEIVELGKRMTGGKAPTVKRHIAGGIGGGMVRGRVRFGQGDLMNVRIELSADIFKDPGQAAETLAHEIGHVNDWFPEGKIEGRGNILGRIASFERYLKTLLDSVPTEPTLVITPEERKEWRREAAAEARQEFPDREDSEQRKQLEKDLYRERIDREIQERGLITRDQIMQELKELSMWWKPFSEVQDPNFTAYRYSPPELYADAVSVLLNNPGALSQRAPVFTSAFLSWLKNKPDFKREYDKIQDMIGSGQHRQARVERRWGAYRKGDEAYANQLNTDIRYADAFRTAFIDAHAVLLGLVKKVGEGNIPLANNPRYKIEDMQYSGAENEFYVKSIYNEVIKKYEATGLDELWFGEFMEMMRIATDRKDIANPQGIEYDDALDRIVDMKEELTQEQWVSLNEAQQSFWRIRQDVVIEQMEKSGMWSDELMQKVKDNEFYAFFDVQEFIAGRYGRGPGSKIYRQVGTLKDITNPFTATLMKDLALISAVNRNEARKSVVEFLQKYYGADQIVDAETKFVSEKQPRQIVDPGDPDLGLIVVMEKGKPKGYYVDKFIADGFNSMVSNEIGTFARGLSWMTQPFRKLFIELNPGFQLFNLHRDFFAAIYILPKATVRNFLPIWASSFKEAFRSSFAIPTSVADAMLKEKMLVSVADPRGMRLEDKALERLLRKFHINRKTWKKQILDPFGNLLLHVDTVQNVIGDIGQGFERVTKVAAKRYLDQHFPDMPTQQKAHLVRLAGSPAFLRKGSLYPLYNNIFLFSNAIKEGYRASGEMISRSPTEFATKYVKFVVIPKMLMWMAKYGFLGWWSQRVFNSVSRYDLSNYTIIPLGQTADGNKAVYWRFPVDELSRLLGGMTWKIMDEFGGRVVDPHPRAPIQKTLQDLVDYMAGQAPTLNPVFKLGGAVVDYTLGKNPYDHFRQRHAIPDLVFEAGGMRSHKEFARWVARNSGISMVYNFKSNDMRGVQSELEKALNFPFIVDNVIGRFLKFSNYGQVERLRAVKELQRVSNANRILDASDAFRKMLDGKQLNMDELVAIMDKNEMLDRNAAVLLSRRWGNAFLSEYLTARTKEEKFAVLQEYLRQNGRLKEK